MKDIRYYIDEQVGALAHILRERAACTRSFVEAYERYAPTHIYLIGSGTSYNAALTAAHAMQRMLRVGVTAHAPSQLPFIHTPRPLVVFISQGGTSTNILRAIEELRGVPSLALTGRRECRVNELCENHVLLACGEEDVGPKTKGYTCTVLTLQLMALMAARAMGMMTEEECEDVTYRLSVCLDRLPERIEQEEERVEKNAAWLTDTACFAIVGKGMASAVAKECVIKLVETMLTPAMAYEFEEFLHGPVSLIDDELGGIYLLPPEGDPDRARMETVARYHAAQSHRVLTVEPLEGTPWYAQAFIWVLLCQLMAAKLPAVMGVGSRGEDVFYAVDKLVDIKFGHVV